MNGISSFCFIQRITLVALIISNSQLLIYSMLKFLFTPALSLLIILCLVSTSKAQIPPPMPPDPVQKQQVDESEGRRLFMVGITEFEFENFEKAVEYLTKAREILGPSAGLDFALSDSYFQLNDLVNAAYYGKSAVELSPENKWYRLKLAEIYRRSGRNQATIDELKAILEFAPADLEVLLNLAQVQTMHGKLLEANRTYDRILQLNGPDIQVYFQKFRNFRTLGQRDSAEVQLKRMQDFEPDNIGVLQTMSQFYLEDQNVEKAIEALQRALELRPGDEETIVALADLYVREGNWDKATELISDIIRNERVQPITKVELGQFMMNRFFREADNETLEESTRAIIELILETEPEFGFSYALAAEFYSFMEELDKLLEVIIETNRLLPENEPAWRQRVQLHLINEEYDKAIEAGKLADEYIPDDAFVLFLVGNAYFMKDEKREAIEWFERAAASPSQREFRSTIYTVIGDSYSGLKEWEAADQAYEMALRLNASNDVALNNFAYYLSTRRERLDDALEMAEKAIAAEPQNAAYLDTIGWIHFKLGNLEKARDFIHASVDTGQASAVVLDHLGDVYEALGNREEAKKWWNKALEMNPDKEGVREKLGE